MPDPCSADSAQPVRGRFGIGLAPGRDLHEFNSRHWPLWGQAGTDRYARRGRIGGVVSAAFFLFFLGDPLSTALHGQASLFHRALVVGWTGLYAVTYLCVLWYGSPSGKTKRSVMVAALYGIGLTYAVILGHPQDLTYMTYAIAAGIMLLPLRISRVLGLVVAAVQLVLMQLINGSVEWALSWVLVVTTLGTAAVFALINTIAQLRVARDEVAKLAVAEERSRVARDLHDVLGHSLTTITVKAGLARRMLETSGDKAAAAQEISEVEQLARQAMTEVRATVSGYREASLPAEIAGARIALRAAGVDADLPHAVDDVPAELQEAFAYVVREGVTNVLRHSKATACHIRLGANWLEIRDNGTTQQADAADSTHVADPKGNGLAGLAERLAKIGGRLEHGPISGGGFRVRATVPDAAAKSVESPTGTATRTEPSVGLA